MLFEIAVVRRLGESRIEASFRSDMPVTALVGPSGAGKTSILNMIAGILRPDEGRIKVGGRPLFDSRHGIDERPEHRRCGYVFQDNRLFPHLSVRQNLLYGYRNARSGARWIDLAEATNLLGLGALLDRRPRTLSGGEARRVAIGRALLSSPDFLLMDEPLSSLDPGRRETILGAIEGIRDRFAIPILYVTHQQDEVARIAGRVISMAAPA